MYTLSNALWKSTDTHAAKCRAYSFYYCSYETSQAPAATSGARPIMP